MAISERDKRAIEAVLVREGGYVDLPEDRGGPTNMGITIRTLMSYRGSPVSPSDVRDLEKSEAVAIYHQRYIEDPRLDLIEHEWLFNTVFDAAVNHGPKRAVLMLQKAACVFPQDGLLGPITAGVVNAMDPYELSRLFLKERILFYARIVRGDPSQSRFIVGWMKRALEVA